MTGAKQTSKVIEGTGLSATFGKDEATFIHQENLQKLSSMSENEILVEQEKLLKSLGMYWIDICTAKYL